MEEQKKKRVFNAVIVGAILFLVIISSIWIVTIVIKNKEQKARELLLQDIAYYQTLTEEERAKIEAMQTRESIIQRAYELGLKLEGDYAID